MNIAIVGPSPIPFVIGGAENLMRGLCDNINKLTQHHAELIKLPVKEFSFWDLIECYYKFYILDLSHFDMVITLKYPSWMVRHPNSICYMMHTLRGLYDTYNSMVLPQETERGNPYIDELLDYMENNTAVRDLDAFFEMLFSLKDNEQIDRGYFIFPGPFIRKIVHYMDSWALRQRGVKKYCAISETVKNRENYFPKGEQVNVIYPPTVLKKATEGGYKYIFMVSRLDAPKRIDLLIHAMKYVKTNVRLKIAGTGPDRERLEQLAGGDGRIEFLGYVSDKEADELYANCLTVPYFPYDEDYGYITIEAMLHKKPVITTVDAGGPTEFVRDGETGFVVEADSVAVAEKIDYLAAHPEKAEKMGRAGYKAVSGITWKKAVEELLDTSPEVMRKNKTNTRTKITVTSTFSIYPPQGGGQARIYNLYKNVALHTDVEVVAFGTIDRCSTRHEIAQGFIETVIPKCMEHQNAESEVDSRVGMCTTDISMIRLSGMTPEYGKKLKESIEDSNLIIISHPYMYNEAKKYMGDKPFIYEAHNVEYLMKKRMLPNNKEAEVLLNDVYETEKACCIESRFIMTCSEEDKKSLCRLYGVSEDKIIVVPNGVDCKETKYVSVAERLQLKKEMGIEDEKIAVFMGSWHKPNLEACEIIAETAVNCPGVKFVLMGSQCLYFKDRVLPSNVGLLGLVSEEEKNRIFSMVDFAVNPMISGSGTNLKMFDYMAAGIPVISTRFGTRGIDNKELFIIAEADEMADVIRKFSLEGQDKRVSESRKYAEEHFDWGGIAEILFTEIKKGGLI